MRRGWIGSMRVEMRSEEEFEYELIRKLKGWFYYVMSRRIGVTYRVDWI